MPLFMSGTGKPRVILGAMTFGPDESAGARITSLDEYNKCLDFLQGQGYNEIDTARAYIDGRQEAFTADAKWKERGLKLATKCYPKEPGTHKPDKLRASLETSLKELKTDCVDIFYLHAADRSVPFAETLEAVNEMHKEGKFVQLGLSNYTAFEVAEVVITCKERGWVRPTIYQGMYNAISKSGQNPNKSILIVFSAIPRTRTYTMLPAVWSGSSNLQPFSGWSILRQDQVGRRSVRRPIQRYRRNDGENVQSTILQRRHIRGSTSY